MRTCKLCCTKYCKPISLVQISNSLSFSPPFGFSVISTYTWCNKDWPASSLPERDGKTVAYNRLQHSDGLCYLARTSHCMVDCLNALLSSSVAPIPSPLLTHLIPPLNPLIRTDNPVGQVEAQVLTDGIH